MLKLGHFVKKSIYLSKIIFFEEEIFQKLASEEEIC
jgi:hypothetical protein